jgi:hypothetical protein
LIFLPGASDYCLGIEGLSFCFFGAVFLTWTDSHRLKAPWCRPDTKIAVNAVGCNEAEAILFRHGIIAE